jgi:hypothetical protein
MAAEGDAGHANEVGCGRPEAMTWRGLGRSAALGPMAVLLAFALVFNLIAVTRFRWEGEG